MPLEAPHRSNDIELIESSFAALEWMVEDIKQLKRSRGSGTSSIHSSGKNMISIFTIFINNFLLD